MLSLKEQLGVTPSLWFMTNCWFSNSVDGWCPCSDTFINTYTLNRIQIHFFPAVHENPVLSVNFFDDFEFHTFDFQLSRSLVRFGGTTRFQLHYFVRFLKNKASNFAVIFVTPYFSCNLCFSLSKAIISLIQKIERLEILRASRNCCVS